MMLLTCNLLKLSYILILERASVLELPKEAAYKAVADNPGRVIKRSG